MLVYMDICGLTGKVREMRGALVLTMFLPRILMSGNSLFKEIPVLQSEGKAVETIATPSAEEWL